MIPEDIERMADWLGRDDPEIQRLLKAVAMDPQMAEPVRHILRKRCRLAGIDPDNPPTFDPVRRLPEGDVPLGDMPHGPIGAVCALPLQIFREHLGISGHSGTGKTCLAKRICSELARKGRQLWVMDVEDEYGDLLTILGPDNAVAVTSDHLRLNFFQPPGPWVSPASWLEEVNLLFRGATFLRDGSLNLFRSELLKLVDAAGVSTGGREYPSLADAVARLGGMGYGPNSRNKGFMDSLLNRFNMLLDAFPRLPDVTDSDMLARLAARNVIFRLADLKGIPLQFLVGFLLCWLMRYREGQPPEQTHVVLIEEAHLQAAEKARMDIGENILSRSFRLARKRGLAFVLCDQIPSELPPAIVGNLGCRIVMRLANPRDIWAIQTSMALNHEQGAVLSELEKRQAVVHYSLYPRAFLIRVPDLQFPAKPSQRELLASGEAALSQSRWRERSGPAEQAGGPSTNAEQPSPDELIGDARAVMLDICGEPSRTIDERCTVLKMDRAREFRARAALDARGLIEQAAQSPGGRVKLYQPTDKGVQWAARQGVRVKTSKSGLVHEYILHHAQRGIGRLGPKWRMQRNCDLGRDQGLQPDLLVLAPEGRRIILEVCCNNMDYEARNLLAEARLPGVDAVVAVTPDGVARRSLAGALTKALQNDRAAAGPRPMTLDAGQCLAERFDWGTPYCG